MLCDPDALIWPVYPEGHFEWHDAPDLETHKDLVWRYELCVGRNSSLPKESRLGTSTVIRETASKKWHDLKKENEKTKEFFPEYAEYLFKISPPKHFYAPTDLPELFIKFINTEPGKDGIIRFVERFGTLGTADSPYSTEDLYRGERLSAWVTEIISLRFVYDLWRALKYENHETLLRVQQKRIDRFNMRGELLLSDGLYAAVYPPPSYPADGRPWLDVAATEAKRPLAESAWDEISHITNVAFQFHGLVLTTDVTPEISGLAIRFTPKNLISTLWLQFLEITLKEHWKVCDYCGKPFEAKNRKKRYCSTSHNQMAYLKRKEAKK